METVYFKGTPCHTCGSLPAVGSQAPCFTLVAPDLHEIKSSDLKGKRIVLNVFPSLDTPVCAASVRRFNVEAAKLENTVVLCVSEDLPFAAGRFCSAEGIDDVTPASAFRSREFGKDYGLQLVDGPLAGLLARAVIVIDETGRVAYADLVGEITDEPRYQEAVDVLKR
ncbi:MAG: thiol peroxidase [Muribaculaceae bacterium]|nr:thiol peroxidase [Muribaculaceae bacterium]